MLKYAEKYPGQSVVGAVNSIIYDLADGGETILGKSHTWGTLKSRVWEKVQSYENLKHLSKETVERQVQAWINVNEKKLKSCV